jgi:serine/threonine-protein kinase
MRGGSAIAISPSLGPALRGYLALFALIVAGALVFELGLRERDGAAAPPANLGEVTPAGAGASASARGYLRVLATPWAEVLIDGELVDTTPIGRPIAVSPGRHFITFRHPNAPDEKRSIQVASGQTAVVDVSMRIDRSAIQDAGAGAGALPDANISP